MKRRVFEIRWKFDKKDPASPDPGWVIRERGMPAPEPDSGELVYSTKAAALRVGRQVARSVRPSQLVVKSKRGRIQREHTYGADPERFPG